MENLKRRNYLGDLKDNIRMDLEGIKSGYGFG
jgi:hypothetical protein